MSFYSPLCRRRAPKLSLKQQQSSLPLFLSTSSTKSRTSSRTSSCSTYTRSSSCKNPSSSSRNPLATDTAELDAWGLAISKRTSSSRESLQVRQVLRKRILSFVYRRVSNVYCQSVNFLLLEMSTRKWVHQTNINQTHLLFQGLLYKHPHLPCSLWLSTASWFG